eukprot:1392466-Amorphochlora_amoeboformis.AAC.1
MAVMVMIPVMVMAVWVFDGGDGYIIEVVVEELRQFVFMCQNAFISQTGPSSVRKCATFNNYHFCTCNRVDAHTRGKGKVS